MKNNLFENIKNNLMEATSYKVAPSYNETDGYSSTSNSEVIESAKEVSQYFKDYANFLLNDEEGQRYKDRDMAQTFLEFANQMDNTINKIVSEWETK